MRTRTLKNSISANLKTNAILGSLDQYSKAIRTNVFESVYIVVSADLACAISEKIFIIVDDLNSNG